MLPALLASGCGSPAPAPPDLLLITLDTVRADRLGCTGWENARTPNLDGLAAESLFFRDAITPYPLTLPAHASMLSAQPPHLHGSRNNGEPPRPQAPSIPALLRDAGYRTGAVVSSAVLHHRFGLDRGFDRYVDETASALDHSTADSLECRASETTDRAIRLWEQLDRATPRFLWVHYFDAHAPYDAPEAMGTGDPYDDEIAYMDREIGRLLASVDLGRTAVLVAADHGEAFGEHGEQEHGYFLYDTTIRVPLFLRPAGEARSGREISHAATLMDVGATLLDLAGLAEHIPAPALSLRDLAGRHEPPPRTLVAETLAPFHNHAASPLAALRGDGWKYVESPEPELYDLREDPDEIVNRAPQESARALGLREALFASHPLEWLREGKRDLGAAPSVDRQTQRQLEALGYAASRPSEEGGGRLPDPKRVLQGLASVREGDRALARGEPDLAERSYREAFEAQPGAWKPIWKLGELLAGSGRLEEAEGIYRRAREHQPRNLALDLRLGWIELATGREDAALASAEKVLRAYPQHREAGILRVEAFAAMGRTLQARTALRSLENAHPDDPELRRLRQVLPAPDATRGEDR